jgi:hypothetical protein
MNENKKSCLCAVLHNHASNIIGDSALWRHYEEQEEWSREMLVSNLRYIVAAAAFLGVTTKNVKKEIEYLVSFFNDKEGRAND